MKTVTVVLGDLGSAKEIVPVARTLESRGVVVKYLADPSGKAGSDVLAKAGIPFENKLPTDDKHDVFLVGTNDSANGLQLSSTDYALRRGIPVVWFEDLYGCGSHSHSRSVTPNVMLVIDDAAKRIAKSVRPDLNVVVVGKPTFSGLPTSQELQELRKSVRTALGVCEDKFLLVAGFGGKVSGRALTQLESIISELEKYSFPELVVAWRVHPKDPQKDEQWQLTLKSSIPNVDSRQANLENLVFASDMTSGDWGNTEPYKAVLCGIPVATMLFPDDVARRLDAGYYPDGVPPIIFGAENWGAKSVGEFIQIIDNVRRNGKTVRQWTANVRAKQFSALKTPGAAERAADVVQSFFK